MALKMTIAPQLKIPNVTASSPLRTTDPCKLGDGDTRISPTELAILASTFQ